MGARGGTRCASGRAAIESSRGMVWMALRLTRLFCSAGSSIGSSCAVRVTCAPRALSQGRPNLIRVTRTRSRCGGRGATAVIADRGARARRGMLSGRRAEAIARSSEFSIARR